MKTRYMTTYKQLINSWADKIIFFLNVFVKFLQIRLKPAIKYIVERLPKAARFFKTITLKKVFVFLCAASVMSQIDFLTEVRLVHASIIIFWFLAFFVFTVKAGFKLYREVLLLLFPILFFDALIFIIGLVKGNLGGYLRTPIAYSANLSAFVFFAGTQVGSTANRKLLLTGARVYVLCAILIAIYTILTNFTGIWLFSETYVYSRKNSLAPIILTAVCCIVFLKIIKNTKLNTLILTLFIGFIILLKCRASMLGLAVAAVVWYVCAVNSRRTRLYAFILFLSATVLILTIPALRNLVVENIILNNRASLGINEVTSGRTEQFSSIFLVYFPKSPLFGNVNMYIESLPLAAILSFGIVAAVPLLIFAFVPLRTAIICKQNSQLPKRYILFLMAISVAFLINCLFEERAPFGPGTTYFFLWFTSGFLIGCRNCARFSTADTAIMKKT